MKEMLQKLRRWWAGPAKFTKLTVEESALFASDLACEMAASSRHSAETAWLFFVMTVCDSPPDSPPARIRISPEVKDAFFSSFEREMEAQRRRQSPAGGSS